MAIQPTQAIRSLREMFEDPITHELIANPVVDSCGHTFDRAGIVRWLQEHHSCPLSRRVFDEADLLPNLIVRDALDILHRIGASLAGRVEDLQVDDRERAIVVQAAEQLQPRTFARAVGDCVERAINCDYKS